MPNSFTAIFRKIGPDYYIKRS